MSNAENQEKVPICWAAFGGLLFIVTRGPKKTVAHKAPSGITRTITKTDATGHSVTVKQEPVRQVSSGLTTTTRTESTEPPLPRPYPYEPIRTISQEPNREIATSKATPNKVLSAEVKREIYAKAASWRAKIASKQQEINERRWEGKSTGVHEKQLEHLRGMSESSLDFACRWYKVSRQEIESIIREGNRQHWAQK